LQLAGQLLFLQRLVIDGTLVGTWQSMLGAKVLFAAARHRRFNQRQFLFARGKLATHGYNLPCPNKKNYYLLRTLNKYHMDWYFYILVWGID
tara:strand:- start:217 stop:492 length:276 start_codon:yes stop_codon:yes gene_type:complete